MKPRPLGNSGLLVSPIGLGLAALGRPGYINLGHEQDMQGDIDPSVMEARAHAVLDAAWAAGVRYFDAARSYGAAERFLGNWLRSRAIPPEEVTIGSKWGYTYTADWRVQAEHHEIKDHSAALLRRQWEETQTQLGGYLDLYQIHSATFESGVLENREVHRELAEIHSTGVRIGLTLSGPQQAEILETAMAIRVDGERLFDTVQATWNLLEPSAGPALTKARNEGMGVVIKEGVANGRLTERNTSADFQDKRAILEKTAHRLGGSLDALALAAILAQPFADVVLSGAATSEQLTSNLQAPNLAWDEISAQELQTLVETSADYWARRSALSWN